MVFMFLTLSVCQGAGGGRAAAVASSLVRHEGLLGLWRGVLPPMAGVGGLMSVLRLSLIHL